MIRMVTRTLLLFSAALFLAPTRAEANMAIPLLFCSLPLMVLALIPVIAIESYVLWALLGTSAAYSALVMAAANVASTIVGVPLSWMLVIPLKFLPGMAPAIATLIAYPKGLDPRRVAIGSCALLVICFFLSWFIEGWVAGLFLGEISAEQLDTAVFAGNAVTYSAIGTFVVGLSIFEWLFNGSSAPSSATEPEMGLIAEELESDEWNETIEAEISEEIPGQANSIQAPSLVPSVEVNDALEQLNGNQSGNYAEKREPAEIFVHSHS